jgi:hypothetical protein
MIHTWPMIVVSVCILLDLFVLLPLGIKLYYGKYCKRKIDDKLMYFAMPLRSRS